MYCHWIKPLTDRIGAMILLILFSPLILLTAGMLWLTSGTPIIFRQPRPGKDGEIFVLYKFKTMTDETDEHGVLLPDEQRLKGAGKVIRSLSLDELPQLWNVLKGDMSLVGPRPLLVEYLPLYNERQRRRHEVKPGITGWAQVNGRNAISWEEKFEYDVWYVEHCSFTLDMKILWMTVKKVFRREGISADSHVTVERFRGNGD